MTPKERVIVCEDEWDREFWIGWLTTIGAVDPLMEGRRRLTDPSGCLLPASHRALTSKSGAFVRLVTAGDRFGALREARRRWDLRKVVFPEHLVLSMDAGAATKDDLDRVRRTIGDRVEQWFERTARSPEGDLTVDGVWVGVVAWGTVDPPKEGLPQGQTLARVVASAMASVNAERGNAVHAWLEAAPKPNFLAPQSHLLSYVAKWYATETGPLLFRKIWQEPELAARLRRRLSRIDAWRVGERLAE